MNHIVVTLDLSTASTGYAIFNDQSNNIITYGVIKPEISGLHKLKYPFAALAKIVYIAQKVAYLIKTYNPDKIIIEEVNRGVNRISQKSLDALHFFVLHELALLSIDVKDKLLYVDSNGKKGWRGYLGIRLSDSDKAENKKIRAKNKKSKLQYAPIDWKVLAERYVNQRLGTTFDVRERAEEADICDAIALGFAYLEHIKK